MSPLIWTGALILVGCLGVVAGLTAAYDQTERRLDREQGCRCPQHDAGGTCAEVES